MGQILGQDNVGQLAIATTTSITMPSTYQGQTVRITVGGQQYAASALVTLNLAATGFNGLDTGSLVVNTMYYIYAVQNAGVLGLVASTAVPATGPTGFAAWKEIGRFRTFVASATAAAISNRLLGNGPNPALAAGSWQAYTPVFTGFSVQPTVNFAQARQVGANIEVMIRTVNGTLSAAALGVTLPGNLSALTGGATTMVGSASTEASTSTYAELYAVTAGGNSVGFIRNTVGLQDSTVTGSTIAGGSTRLTFLFNIPIAEYVGLFD